MRVLAVYAHPNLESYTAAVFRTAIAALRTAGHQVDTVSLYEESFPAAMTAAERRRYDSDDPIIDDQVRRHANLLMQAEALIFVYPTWWFGLPAILKGWLERVFLPGVAFTLDSHRRVRPRLLKMRRIVGITTYGSSHMYVRLTGDGGRRTLLRAIRLLCPARTRSTWLGLYGIGTGSEAQRRAFLLKVEHRMKSL